MRQSLAANLVRASALTALCVVLVAAPAFAQQASKAASQSQQQLAQALAAAAQASVPGQGVTMGGAASGYDMGQDTYADLTDEEYEELMRDRESSAYKANALADVAKREKALENFARNKVVELKETVTDRPTPPELDSLQNIHLTLAGDAGLGDEEIDGELLDLDIRRDAQREAALSYGARGGLAKRAYQISERFDDYEPALDRVFNFRALLIRAPSGLLIEPPIVREEQESVIVNAEGTEAAVADRVLDINKQAKIVTAPRDWRHYLYMPFSAEIAPPPRVLWPQNKKEQAEWNNWVRQGWVAGYEQGEDTFNTNLNKLVTDYNGMVRYRMLLAQGMISQPYALHEDRGVTGDKTIMRVGDRALRITGPSQFLTGSELWKPADR